MCLICDGGDLSQFISLKIENCPLLTNIPLLPNLTDLYYLNHTNKTFYRKGKGKKKIQMTDLVC
jgi:hypothetical protein